MAFIGEERKGEGNKEEAGKQRKVSQQHQCPCLKLVLPAPYSLPAGAFVLASCLYPIYNGIVLSRHCTSICGIPIGRESLLWQSCHCTSVHGVMSMYLMDVAGS